MATPRSCFVQALLDTPSPLPHLTRHGDGAGGHVTDVRSTARPRDAPPARPSARGTLSLYKKPKLVVVVPYRVRLDTSSTPTPHHRRAREHAMHVYRQSPAPAHMPRRTPRADHSGDALYCCVLEELVRLVYILSFISSNFFCAATLAASAASAAAEAAAALALPNRPPSAPSSSCSSLHWSSSSRS